MKKFILFLLVTLSASAMAYGHHGGHRGGYRGFGGWGWTVPAVVGGVVLYEATRPVVVQQPVIIQQPMTVQQQPNAAPACSPWTETQHADGSITRTRTCNQ